MDEQHVYTGFPSQAGEYRRPSLNLHMLLAPRPLSAFFVRFNCDAMSGADIRPCHSVHYSLFRKAGVILNKLELAEDDRSLTSKPANLRIVIPCDRGLSNVLDSIVKLGDTVGGPLFMDLNSKFHEPLFFIGSRSLAKARHFDRCMISINELRKRRSDFEVNDWILDSGAFTELSRFGRYRHGVEDYAGEIRRWSVCGRLLAAVCQDYMCERFILDRTGLSVAEHQRLTIERYDALLPMVSVYLMPVLQGYRVSDYLSHLDQYGERLKPGAWVGVGSVCKRNGRPDEVADILASIKNKRPDLRLHGFGLKLTALGSREVREFLYSSDSTAWTYPSRFGKGDDSLETADAYLERVRRELADSVPKRLPAMAGPGNGQGRKPKWNRMPTTAIRVPSVFAERLIEVAREWDTPAVDFVQNQKPRYPAALTNYDGGKGGDGVFQKIINEIPPHDIYIEGCLGGGAVMRRKRPARVSYGVDLDPDVIREWEIVNFPGLRLQCGGVVKFLDRFAWSGAELVYLDPPYLAETRSHKGRLYKYEMMTEREHIRLLKAVKRIPARVIISGYWSDLYARELEGWRAVSFRSVKRSGEPSEEWLWLNYPQPLELHDYRYLGSDFRERERIRRKRQRWENKLRSMPAPESLAIAAAVRTVCDERRGPAIADARENRLREMCDGRQDIT